MPNTGVGRGRWRTRALAPTVLCRQQTLLTWGFGNISAAGGTAATWYPRGGCAANRPARGGAGDESSSPWAWEGCVRDALPWGWVFKYWWWLWGPYVAASPEAPKKVLRNRCGGRSTWGQVLQGEPNKWDTRSTSRAGRWAHQLHRAPLAGCVGAFLDTILK